MTNWKQISIGEFVDFNPSEKIEKGKVAKKVPMAMLTEFERKIKGFELAKYQGGPKFRNGDTLVAKITPCLENGKTAQVDIKQNVLKNRFARTVCRYEEFGVDTTENRLLHKAFMFACSYLDNHRKVYGKNTAYFTELINYCRPAFASVSSEVSVTDIKGHKPNPFFKEYTEGIHLAKVILKRYAYTISNTANKVVTTPPYWIDMPRLFELYAYHFLKKRFPKRGEITYHLTTYGNELDFLLNSGNLKMVIDAKYKPVYIYGKNHNDMRQLSGYARLEVVYKKLGLASDDDHLVDCLVIYPDVQNGSDESDFCITDLKAQPISGYRKIYKIGVKLPVGNQNT